MDSTNLVSDLFATCEAETARLLAGFDAAPTRTGLLDAGAVAELVVLGESVPGIKSLRETVCYAAASWLRRGILEEFCFARAELAYQTALLAFLAQGARDYRAADMAVVKRLCEGRLVGRSEMPVLTQQLTAAYLTRCGIVTDFGDAGERDMARMIDKRVLRPRSDEYDLSTVIMCAQLMRLEPDSARTVPSLYPQALLVQAIRSRNANWVPVLAYLCAHWFGLDDRLKSAAQQIIRETRPSRGELLPAPAGAGIDTEYIGQAARGLRIRSTIALACSLCMLGDSNVEENATLAVA